MAEWAVADFGNEWEHQLADMGEGVAAYGGPVRAIANFVGHATNLAAGVASVWTAADYARYRYSERQKRLEAEALQARLNPSQYPGDARELGGGQNVPWGYQGSFLPQAGVAEGVDTARSRIPSAEKIGEMVAYVRIQNEKRVGGPRGFLRYVDAYLDDLPIIGTNDILQLHMTDAIVAGTGMFGKRTGRQIWSHLLNLKGTIFRNLLWTNPFSVSMTSVLVEYGVLYDKSGNASAYQVDDFYYSNDNSTGHRINAPENVYSEDRFVWLFRRKKYLNWSLYTTGATVNDTSMLIDDLVDIPDLITTYPDATSPPNTGEIFIYFMCDQGSGADSPMNVRLTARLRYFDNGPDDREVDVEEGLYDSQESDCEEQVISNIPIY